MFHITIYLQQIPASLYKGIDLSKNTAFVQHPAVRWELVVELGSLEKQRSEYSSNILWESRKWYSAQLGAFVCKLQKVIFCIYLKNCFIGISSHSSEWIAVTKQFCK